MIKRTSAILLFTPMLSWAIEVAPAPVALKPISNGERESLYEEQGMRYAKGLYLDMSGSNEDELRSKKSELLNYKIREKGIRKLEGELAKAKEPRIRQEVLHRLSNLYDQQAEIITRRSDLKDKETAYKLALRNANRYLTLLKDEFPKFAPDATIFNLAENYGKLKEDKLAEKYYRDIIARFPKSPVVADSLLALGNLYFERQAFFAARAFYEKILTASEPTLYPYAHYKMAWCYFNENDFPQAIARLESSILESRRLSAKADKKLGVEEEALSDLVLFFAEYGNPSEAKSYFAKLVDNEKANELRFQLSKRLFEYGKHQMAKNVAKELLDEHPQKEFVNKLYLILISVAERTKDRDFGLKTAENLSKWVKNENLASNDSSRVESEEYMRNYSQKLHHEAETLKQKEVWDQARKSYEIYLATFPNEPDAPEVKFRYAVLLLNRKEQLKAYRSVTEAVTKMEAKHPRYKDALKIRIQAVEMATKEERKQIEDKDLMGAYDAYAKAFPDEDLGIEASFKAANLAKNIETPEQTAARYRALAEAHPKHNLAKAAVGEALAVLVKAQKWEALGAESRTLGGKAELQSGLLAGDSDLTKRIAEARELSLVKITEGLEADGKVLEAKAQYEKMLNDSPSETMGIYSLVRLASLAETKQNLNKDAINYFEKLKDKYPASKEARQASLEMARLFEKVNEPREAVRRYMEFASTGRGKLETQALTNSAVILEGLGEREAAADAFLKLSEAVRASRGPEKDAVAALEASCNNLLLGSYQNHERRVLQRIHECARQLSANGQSVQWQARAAWALDQMADGLQSDERWSKLANRNLKATAEGDRAYVAMAKLKHLQAKLAEFKGMRFTKTNERPEANIGNKTKALEDIEKLAENIMKVGTGKQILSARDVIRQAYLDFAETMETANVPSKLADADKEELKKSFVTFATGFREKAATFADTAAPAEEGRKLASVAPAKESWKIAGLTADEKALFESGTMPSERAAEIFAKKAYSLYEDGKYGEARFYSEKWKKQLNGSEPATVAFGMNGLNTFQGMLADKLPELDPVSKDF